MDASRTSLAKYWAATDRLCRGVGALSGFLGSVGLPQPTAIWFPAAFGSLGWMLLNGSESRQGSLIMVAVALASAISGIVGFAFAAISGAMLFHLNDDPIKVVQIMITCSIANQLAMVWAGRRDIDWSGLTFYFVGGMAGLTLGVWALIHVDRSLYTHLFGVFLLCYGLYMLRRPAVVLRHNSGGAEFLVGVLGGITGGVAGFPGAFVTIWCGLKGWNKSRQRAVVQPFILVMQIAALLVISFACRKTGHATGFDAANLLFIPASLIGTQVGLAVYRTLTDRQFAGVANVLLIFSGVSFVF